MRIGYAEPKTHVLAVADLDLEGPDTPVLITAYDCWNDRVWVYVDVIGSHRSYYIPASAIKSVPE